MSTLIPLKGYSVWCSNEILFIHHVAMQFFNRQRCGFGEEIEATYFRNQGIQYFVTPGSNLECKPHDTERENSEASF